MSFARVCLRAISYSFRLGAARLLLSLSAHLNDIVFSLFGALALASGLGGGSHRTTGLVYGNFPFALFRRYAGHVPHWSSSLALLPLAFLTEGFAWGRSDNTVVLDAWNHPSSEASHKRTRREMTSMSLPVRA